MKAYLHDAESEDDNAVMATAENQTKLLRKSFCRLLFNDWLDDEIPNAYLQSLCKYANASHEVLPSEPRFHDSHGKANRVVCLSSFWYKQVQSDINATALTLKTALGQKKRDAIIRLEECEWILIPIHQQNHWTLLVISPMHRTIEHFDSLRHAGDDSYVTEVIANAERWLKYVMESRYNRKEWTIDKTRGIRQSDTVNCGVAMLLNAAMVVKGVDMGSVSISKTQFLRERQRICYTLLESKWIEVLEVGEK